MTDRKLRYLIHLNVSLIHCEEAYKKAKNGHNKAKQQSALFNLRCAKTALKSYITQLIREGHTPLKTVNPELFSNAG